MLLLISERQSRTTNVIIPVPLWCDGIFCSVHLQILELIVRTAANRDGALSVNTCHNGVFLSSLLLLVFSISVHNYYIYYDGLLQINFVQQTCIWMAFESSKVQHSDVQHYVSSCPVNLLLSVLDVHPGNCATSCQLTFMGSNFYPNLDPILTQTFLFPGLHVNPNIE